MKKKLNLQGVDLRHVRTGRAWVHEAVSLVVITLHTAFTLPGALLFAAGAVFGLGLIAR
jgi:hypothetical protein